jgi:hypothetical protein
MHDHEGQNRATPEPTPATQTPMSSPREPPPESLPLSSQPPKQPPDPTPESSPKSGPRKPKPPPEVTPEQIPESSPRASCCFMTCPLERWLGGRTLFALSSPRRCQLLTLTLCVNADRRRGRADIFIKRRTLPSLANSSQLVHGQRASLVEQANIHFASQRDAEGLGTEDRELHQVE